jgi:hypothetical protein
MVSSSPGFYIAENSDSGSFVFADQVELDPELPAATFLFEFAD